MAASVLTRAPSLWEQVYDIVRLKIVNREIEPGRHLVETQLAEQFGVSRNPVREAIRALERDGWVARDGGHGVYVPTPGGERAREVFEARRCIEGEVSALAAQRIIGEQLSELDSILEQGWAALDRGDCGSISELNKRFHQIVVQSTNNAILEELTSNLNLQTAWHFVQIATARGSSSWEEHEKMVVAFRNRDADAARRLMFEHVDNSRAMFKQVEQERDTNV